MTIKIDPKSKVISIGDQVTDGRTGETVSKMWFFCPKPVATMMQAGPDGVSICGEPLVDGKCPYCDQETP